MIFLNPTLCILRMREYMSWNRFRFFLHHFSKLRSNRFKPSAPPPPYSRPTPPFRLFRCVCANLCAVRRPKAEAPPTKHSPIREVYVLTFGALLLWGTGRSTGRRWRPGRGIFRASLREKRKSRLVTKASSVVFGDTSRPVDDIRRYASDLVGGEVKQDLFHNFSLKRGRVGRYLLAWSD